MRRFEFSEGTSNKFWEAAATGKELRIRFGKIGSNGQTKLKALASPAAAAAELAKLVAEKTKKGYVEIGAAKTNGVAKPEAPASTTGITPAELVLKSVKGSMGSIHRTLVDGRMVIVTGDRCLASSDCKTFHRRSAPGGQWFGMRAYDGVIYTSSGAMSKDAGVTWTQVKLPYDGWLLSLRRDTKGTWWVGTGEGVLTSASFKKGWKKAKFKTPGKVLDFVEVDDKLFVMGAGCGTWDGKAFKSIKGLPKTTPLTRLTETPAGTLIAIGDGGVAYRSTDRGKSFSPVKTGVTGDLEDCAWVAGALFVVGGGGVLLRSTNDGKSFTKVKTDTVYKIWTISSWGDGAILGGDDGRLLSLTAPADPYWKGAKDEFAPPPLEIDTGFQPFKARTQEERDQTYTALHAEAIEAHEARSAKLRAKRAPDGNATLASEVDQSDDALSVYADWLTDQGDPRGELAQVQLRLEKDPKNKELKKTEKELLKKHAVALLGKLEPVADLLELEWRAGFIRKARIANTFERSSMHDGALTEVDLDDVLGWLLDEPSARFMRELVLGIFTYEDNDYGNAAAVIGKHYLPSLRTLFIGDFHSEETELNWSSLGSLDPMYAALPNLRELTLRSGSGTLGSIVLPNLERFSIITGGLDGKAAKAIATAKWPALKTLNVQVGSSDYGGTAKLKDLQPLLDGATLPRLEVLGLTNLEFTNQLIEPIAASKILPQLTGLNLEMGTLGDEGVATLFRLQRAFAHLEALDLDDNYITSEGKAVLTRTKLPIEFGEQRDDEGDPSNRYASAYE